MKIALTGGIACGKSLASRFFRESGFATLDADDVVHELQAPGGAAVRAICSRFGPSVLAPDGGIDRKKLADIVFTVGPRAPTRPQGSVPSTPQGSVPTEPQGSVPSAPLRDLEAILHPLVRVRMLDFAGRTAFGRISIIPLLFESHWESDYDTILCVSSAEELQLDRMMRTRGYTRAQAEARLAAQMPVAEKAARADWTIHNDSTMQELEAEVRRCVAWLSRRMEQSK